MVLAFHGRGPSTMVEVRVYPTLPWTEGPWTERTGKQEGTRSGQRRMNCEQCDLKGLEVERLQVKEVLKILLHAIIFQRALGEVRIRDSDSELFDISYTRCDSRIVEQKVEEHAEAFSNAFDRALERVATVQLSRSASLFVLLAVTA